ncbi:Imm70 family immunity protein [Sphingomonas sp. AOB5]|uniref:Imm70 family immunity protein n=1 Tax=Sphingomonas sp. AOB5 TaxID=3034017 RepID=UPI0023F92228|nr:Imm70 family immunity protein [Sphingomonas sp. AOB5]MDF7776849.1 Imm70 family immunity protein [Sphingomonas sp. AOB5]
MGVGIRVGSITDEIGTGDFLHAFFSTVSGRLERDWGERFPSLMTLYRGSLPADRAAAALTELAEIRSELAAFPPDQLIWDIEDLTKLPPWGSDISPDITDLSNYFVTSAGRDLIDVMREALEASRAEHRTAEIVAY